MNDKELYKKCLMYGRQVLQARRKFIGLLPEVFKRQLYLKKGCVSIHEFAAKLGGISHEQVDTVLHLEKKYEDKPVLHAALVEGKISVNKLVRIASIATTENQDELAKKAELLSNRALEVYVKDLKNGQSGLDIKSEEHLKNQQGEQVTAKSAESGVQKPLPTLHVQTTLVKNDHNQNRNLSASASASASASLLALDEDIENELAQMQQKGIDVNAFLRKCLEQRKQQIEQEKEQLSQEARQQQEKKALIGMPTSRYIPVKIQKIIKAEYGTKCAKEGCNKPSANIHHENHFSKSHMHDVRHMKPLCKAHHELEHYEDAKFQMFRVASSLAAAG